LIESKRTWSYLIKRIDEEHIEKYHPDRRDSNYDFARVDA
jgi:hypothetical protein